MNFKVGDKVKVIKRVLGKSDWGVGTIVNINSKSPYPIRLNVKGIADYGFMEEELELYTEEYKVTTINNDGINLNDIFSNGSYEININDMEEVKEDKMEKTFKEVIADIKQGEVWESNLKTIKCHSDGIQIYHKDEKRCTPSMLMINHVKFKLQRKEYTFQQAFAAYEEGKEIESCKYRYKNIDNRGYFYSSIIKQWNKGGEDFHLNEIRNKWYINE